MSKTTKDKRDFIRDYYAPDSISIEILDDLEAAEAEVQRLHKLLDWHINHCEKDGGECIECSMQHCPHHDPLHFHHDGCPSCP